MKKLGTTVYGLIGTDNVKISLALLDDIVMWVREDGSNAPVWTMPTSFRTVGDMSHVLGELGHRVNVASVPNVALPSHTWKQRMSLEQLAQHRYQGPAVTKYMDALLTTYAAAPGSEAIAA